MTVPWAKRSTNQTLVTHALVGINAAVFLGMALAGISITSPTTQQLVHWGANWVRLRLAVNGGGCSPACSCTLA